MRCLKENQNMMELRKGENMLTNMLSKGLLEFFIVNLPRSY